MRVLYQARDSLEARQVLDRLEGEGISAVVLGEHLAGGAGELSALNFPAIWLLDNAQLLRARGVLDRFLEDRQVAPEDAQDWQCPSCGEPVGPEFGLCWNCGRRRS